MNSTSRCAISLIMALVILTSCTNTPTQNPSVNPTVKPKPAFTLVAKLTSTPPPTNTPETQTIIYEDSTSPDGRLTATTLATFNENDGDVTFTITNNLDGNELVIEKTEIPGPIHMPLIFDYPYVFHWSNDGQSFYYSYLSLFGDGCFSISEPGGLGLKRYDFSSGETITILENGAKWMAFSPKESQLAYIEAYGNIVFILNMENNSVQPFAPPSIDDLGLPVPPYADFMHWSPDGKSLIYTYIVGACEFNPLMPYYYIIQLFPDLSRQTILVAPDEHSYVPVEWNTQNKILLKDHENKKWWLDPITKEITPADP